MCVPPPPLEKVSSCPVLFRLRSYARHLEDLVSSPSTSIIPINTPPGYACRNQSPTTEEEREGREEEGGEAIRGEEDLAFSGERERESLGRCTASKVRKGDRLYLCLALLRLLLSIEILLLRGCARNVDV